MCDPEVQLREDLCLLQALEVRGDEWKWVAVLDSDIIHSSTVDAGSQGVVS